MDLVWQYLKYFEIKRLGLTNQKLYTNILQQRITWSTLLYRDIKIQYNDDDALIIYQKIKQVEKEFKGQPILKYREYVWRFWDQCNVIKPLLDIIEKRYCCSFNLRNFITDRHGDFNINNYIIKINLRYRQTKNHKIVVQDELSVSIKYKIHNFDYQLLQLSFRYPVENEKLLSFLDFFSTNDIYSLHLLPTFLLQLHPVFFDKSRYLLDDGIIVSSSNNKLVKLEGNRDYIIKDLIKTCERIDDILYQDKYAENDNSLDI